MDKEPVHAKIKLTVLATGVLLLAQVHRKSNVVHICIHGCYFDPNITTSTGERESIPTLLFFQFFQLSGESQGEEVIYKDGRSKVL